MVFLFVIGIGAAGIGAIHTHIASHVPGAHACDTRTGVSVAQLQRRLAADSRRAPIGHAAPLVPFTVPQAHRAMLAHLDCDFRRCPCKAAAWEIVRPRIRSAVPGVTR
ncbi:hypothetical protein AWN90_39970 [Nocardia terpenica]|uniref:Uncharacterized protein n=1 Tax=Nocardia terpenica TaxID=455432 RepID=A0A164JUR0_9NOCA|nr:hypothetical protein AWN90_39970 [Nocardia terpenica]